MQGCHTRGDTIPWPGGGIGNRGLGSYMHVFMYVYVSNLMKSPVAASKRPRRL